MSRYLISTCEVYRVSSEDEAAKLIAEAKKDSRFTVLKSSTEYKTVKAKGEIVDEFWKVSVTKQFTDLKEPDRTVAVAYNVDYGSFPQVYNNDIDTDDDENAEF